MNKKVKHNKVLKTLKKTLKICKTIKKPLKLISPKLKKLKLSLFRKKPLSKTSLPISKNKFKPKHQYKFLWIKKSKNLKKILLKWLLKPTLPLKISKLLKKIYTQPFKIHYIRKMATPSIKASISMHKTV